MPEVKRDAKGRIVKGSSGNPGGLPKVIQDLRGLTEASKTQTIRTLHEFSNLKLDQLTQVLANKDSTTMEAVIARLYSKAISGSMPHAAALLDRIIGTVPRALVTQDEDGKTVPMKMTVNTDRVLALMVQLNELPEDDPCKLIPNLLEQSPELSAQLLPPQSATES